MTSLWVKRLIIEVWKPRSSGPGPPNKNYSNCLLFVVIENIGVRCSLCSVRKLRYPNTLISVQQPRSWVNLDENHQSSNCLSPKIFSIVLSTIESIFELSWLFHKNAQSAKINSFLKNESKLNRVLSCKIRFLWLCTNPTLKPATFFFKLYQNLFFSSRLCSRNFLIFEKILQLIAVIHLVDIPPRNMLVLFGSSFFERVIPC